MNFYRQLNFPPMGPPGGGQGPGFGPPTGGPPGFGPPGQSVSPGGGGPGSGPPTSPPPSTPPLETVSFGAPGGPTAFAVDPGAFFGCLYRFTWVRLNNGESFWFYPTFIGRRSVAGYRWFFFRWVYFGIDTNRIRSFQCV
ncbi:hypothetical protein [Sutcliffiella rhizosphaerae]|uniref:Transporter n=1 Tax=Sutcliffiella rhizosphaerae TaxID=2880967 RepID=A0ABM8YNZ2_9BACI|nr:hypothetical protein [Sutcliffiella rhizosphaerae]CAG9621717.1 hypothetical protein BACCIP111883_02490 [Sutcliffiella rhizosphaerae]